MELCIRVDDRELRGAPVPPGLACAVQVQRLDVGDFELVRGADSLVTFERKSVADMVASIKDGRYREQKQRLLAWQEQAPPCVPRRVAYIIEGGGDWGSLEPCVQTAVFKLMFDNNFGVIFTHDAGDTWKAVEAVAVRIAGHKFRVWSGDNMVTGSQHANGMAPAAAPQQQYLSCVKLKKADNIASPQDVAVLQLTVIPRVSVTAAKAILAATGSTTICGVADFIKQRGVAALADIRVGNKRLGQALAGRINDLLLPPAAEELPNQAERP